MRAGDKITVVVTALDFESKTGYAIDAEPLRTHVLRRGTVHHRAGGRITYDWHEDMAVLLKDARGTIGGTDTVAYRARGTLWARGWDGPEVEALKVAVALA